MKKFLYKDSSNKTTEAESYETSDFLPFYTGGSGPVKTGLDGKIDSSLLPSIAASTSTRLEISRLTSVVMSAMKVVKSNGVGGIDYADSSISFASSQALGISLTSGAIGSSIQVGTSGIIQDSIFGAYSVNDQLYLGASGTITGTPPTSGWSVVIGKVLGNDQFMIEIKSPIKLL